MPDVFEKKWLSIAEIAAVCELPENTVRRYINVFKPLLETKNFNRSTKLTIENVPILIRINKLFKENLTAEEVRAILSKEYTTTLDVEDEEITEILPEHLMSIPPYQLIQTFQWQNMVLQNFVHGMIELTTTLQEQNQALLKRVEQFEEQQESKLEEIKESQAEEFRQLREAQDIETKNVHEKLNGLQADIKNYDALLKQNETLQERINEISKKINEDDVVVKFREIMLEREKEREKNKGFIAKLLGL